MYASANVLRSDLAKVQLVFLFRLMPNYFLYLMIFLGTAYGGRELLCEGITLYLVMVVLVASLVFLAFLAIGIGLTCIFASEEQGFIGDQEFAIEDSGFREKAGGSETFTEWRGIKRVLLSKTYVFVQISGYRVHVIPKRSFQSETSFEDFGKELRSRLNAAQGA